MASKLKATLKSKLRESNANYLDNLCDSIVSLTDTQTVSGTTSFSTAPLLTGVQQITVDAATEVLASTSLVDFAVNAASSRVVTLPAATAGRHIRFVWTVEQAGSDRVFTRAGSDTIVGNISTKVEGNAAGDGDVVAVATSTAAIMTASNFMRSSGGATLGAVVLVSYIVFKVAVTKSPAIRYKWHQQVLKMPVFGDMILKSLIARISLIMGNLSAAGVNLLESIEIAKSVSNNDVVTKALENVKKGVFSGDTLTKLFMKEPIFPPTFSQLISVGEQTGNLDEMFNSVSGYYEEEFDTAVDNMSSLIEPIMIVFMGTMIGGLMIAMYSPIFNVGSIIGS